FVPLAASALGAFAIATSSAACGSRTPLPIFDDEHADGAIHPSVDAGSTDASDAGAPRDASTRDASAKRCTNAGPLDGWFEVDVNLGGDYERLVAAAAWEGSDMWLAAGGRAIENGATRLLRVEVKDGAPRIAEDTP